MNCATTERHVIGEAVAPVRFAASDIDVSVDPLVDLDHYVNARWRAANPVPHGRSCWDCFAILEERALRLQTTLVQSLALRSTAREKESKLVSDFWISALDNDRSTSRRTLHRELARIDAIDSAEALATYLREIHCRGLDFLFNIEANRDFDEPSKNILFVSPAPLGLPDASLYSDRSDRGVSIRAAYRKYIVDLSTYNEFPEPDSFADSVLHLEQKLAALHPLRVEWARNIAMQYAPMSIEEITRNTPVFSWTSFLSKTSAASVKVSFAVPTYYSDVENLLQSLPLAQWRNYLKFRLCNEGAPFVDTTSAELHGRFFETFLRGRIGMPSLERRALNAVNRFAGDALSVLYAEGYGSMSARRAVIEMFELLRTRLHRRLSNNPWMSPSTRDSALKKAAAMRIRVGGPNSVRGTFPNTVPDDWFGNVLSARRSRRNDDLARAGQPCENDSTLLTAQTVNARYVPTSNEIVVADSLLQPPFYDEDAGMAVNLGGIGAVIAHEMFHAFDDQGSRFDTDGRFSDCWSAADRERFAERCAELSNEFSTRTDFDDAPVNQRLTLGENIADVCGLALAYDAFEVWLSKNQNDAHRRDGLTHTQRFFVNWAALWRQNLTAEERTRRHTLDVHAPNRVRANAAPCYLPSFYDAFGTKSEQPAIPIVF